MILSVESRDEASTGIACGYEKSLCKNDERERKGRAAEEQAGKIEARKQLDSWDPKKYEGGGELMQYKGPR